MDRERIVTEIEQRNQAWVAAELAGDTAALDRLLADDFLGIGPLGFVLNKVQWLGRYRGGGLHYDSFALTEAHTRPYGDAAIVTGRQEQSGTVQGRELPSGGRATLIWVRHDDGWRLAGWQLSPIADAPGH